MHLFAIAVDIPSLPADRLAVAVAKAGRQFELDPHSAWQASSSNTVVAAAGMHHGEAAAPRRYLAREGMRITLFDGLPVDPHGRHAAYDANDLARGWDSWSQDLEGQFCAARIDLESARVEVLLDNFGLMPVYVAHHEQGVLASNSVGVIRSLLSSSAPDPLGVSTMLGLGWASRRHTLLRDVTALSGGARHQIQEGRVASRAHFGPEVFDRASGASRSLEELATYMTTMTASAVRGISPVRCAVTAGRDSRLVLAMVRARDIVAEFYTIGRPSHVDVIWGQKLAQSFDLAHQVVVPDENLSRDWVGIASRLIAQTDGLSDLGQMVDLLQPHRSQRLGLKLSGIGGELGRGIGDNTIAAANVPLIGHLAPLQRRVLTMKANSQRAVMTREAQEMVDRHTRGFFDDRLAEGWHVNEVAELFFAFERVGGHGSTAPRRAAVADDLFSPYCSRGYAEYCLAMSPAQRYVELPYQQLLSRISPELFNYPFKNPMPSAKARRAGLRAVRDLADIVTARAKVGRAPAPVTNGRGAFMFRWVEQNLELMRELFAHDDSPLWEFVARDRIQALLDGGPDQRQAHLEGLLRSATIFWYIHGHSAS